ncbi:MAG: hypothetical protein U0840_03000 [Gemmataceae bacterium]
MPRNMWLVYVALAGLSWGTYVPLIFYGGSELVSDPKVQTPARVLAILCVGVAYFVIGVLYPAFYLLRLPKQDRPERSFTGLFFSGLAGAAGAVGAICVIFATSNSILAARATDQPPGTYKLFIAPLIFGLAPVINTLVSIFWHPKKGEPFHFGWHVPHGLLWVGIVSVGLGAGLVLYSKGLLEEKAPAHAQTVDEKPRPTLMETITEGYTGKAPWLLFVTLAGLSWGTYVPLIFYGGSELGGKPSSRLLAILCVGVAYFLLAVVFPGIYLWQTPADQQPRWSSSTGLTFAGLAGAAGAIGAICVIFATKSAIEAAKAAGRPPATYKLFIAPLIFGLAPVINTLVSMVWLPEAGDPLRFGLLQPHWTLYLGIVLVGLGAALVLYSKELSEAAPAPRPAPVPEGAR